MIVSWTISPLIAWINVVGPEPYGALSYCGLVRLFTLKSKVTFETHWMIHVTVELLFPSIHSGLAVAISTVLVNTYHEFNALVSVHVRIIVPLVHPVSVHNINACTGILIFAGTRSVSVTLVAFFPPLFP